MQLSTNDLFLLGQCAVSAACQAGHLIARASQQSVAVNTKAGGTSLAAQVVTEIDHSSQEVILDILQPTCRYFDLALLSEESPDDGERLRKDYFWCIDPLDGTLPFIERVPGYSVSIALVSRSGVPVIGVVYDPLTQTLYRAGLGQGAWENNQRLTLAEPVSAGQQSLIVITDKSFAQDPLYQPALDEFDRMAVELGYAGAEMRLQGGAAMNACQVLMSERACYVKFPKPKPGGGSVWDYAATACLFKECGLPNGDIFGTPLALNPAGPTFMNHCGILYCSNKTIRDGMQSAYQRLFNR